MAVTAAALMPDCRNAGHEKTGALLLCMLAAPSQVHLRLKPFGLLVTKAIVEQL